jgi:hypothetical protein
LIEFGSHTHTHRNFVRRHPYENLKNELMMSKNVIEKETGCPCHHLAWPWGDYEKAWWPLVKEVGYTSAMTTQAGANSSRTSPYGLKRFKVSHEGVNWLHGRMRWHAHAWSASSFALFYGWDRRFKTWLHSETPYSHG